MEEPSLRALATERLAERGASPDAVTDRRQLREEIAKGELGPLPILSADAPSPLRRAEPMPGGLKDQHEG